MTALMASAEVSLAQPERCAEAMCAHFLEHDYVVTALPQLRRIAFPGGLGLIEIAPDGLLMRAEAPDAGALHLIRLSLASHLAEFAGEGVEIVWTGDLSDASTPPNFREARVLRMRDLPSGLRRVTLTGEDLGRFDAVDLHIKLLIPHAGVTPAWPRLGRDGLLKWPEGRARPAMRTYTIRRIDVAAGEIDIDMVRHADHPGPGSLFAATARPGDPVGIIGPGGRNVRPAEWYLLAGDETALPAIARILSQCPGSAQGLALIEAERPAGADEIVAPPGIEIRWFARQGRPAGTTTLLQDAVQAVSMPSDRPVFAWAGAEFTAAQTIRAHWRRVCGLTREQHLCVAYWRRGRAEGA